MQNGVRLKFAEAMVHVAQSEHVIKWCGREYTLVMIEAQFQNAFDLYRFHLQDGLSFEIYVYADDALDFDYDVERDPECMRVTLKRATGSTVEFFYK